MNVQKETRIIWEPRGREACSSRVDLSVVHDVPMFSSVAPALGDTLIPNCPIDPLLSNSVLSLVVFPLP